VKVLVLIDSVSSVGGAERLALELSTRLDRERFDVTLCATRSATAGAEAAATAAGVRVLSLERRRTLSPVAWLRLWRLLRRDRIHVLHAHKFGSNVWGALVGTAARVPVVIAHEHSWAFAGDPVRRTLDRHVVGRLSDAVVAVSRPDAMRMVEVERMPRGRVRLIPNGITPAAESGRDVRAELGIPATAPVVGAVTLLRPEKALEVLVEAIARLRSFPDIRLVIAGEGPSRPALEALAADLGLAKSVLLLGERDDVPDVLRSLDVAVICSDFEGTPLALLEYMAAGKAIVATRTGGIPDIIEDGVHGVLVPPRDPPATAAAIERLLGDPSARVRLGAAARERRRREFDLETTVARIAALYEELLAR
jgi:glycosyltransferase involved in cell wall biosynthesis